MAEVEPGATAQKGEPVPPSLSFLKGGDDALKSKDGRTLEWETAAATIREQLSEAMGSRHVAFLMGAGCSSLMSEGKQVGIDTMRPLAKEFTETIANRGDKIYVTKTDTDTLKNSLGLDITAKEFSSNLERLMEVLYSHRFVLARSILPRHEGLLRCVVRVIDRLQTFLFSKCTQGAFSRGDHKLISLYEAFYRKLIFRDRSLPRPWVFTLNYDLFNEAAMDRLGLPYCNGFSGTVERRFNPSVFRYALAEQLDIASRKWSVVDGFVYLCKLHGSINWSEDDHGLFPIREHEIARSNSSLMIYPSPAKQNASLGSPYADLFREFQSRIVREQSVLFTLGYGFGDEHVNNIIYQALTVPTFRLIVFAAPDSTGEIAKLRELRDPRVWIIGGSDAKGQKAHYFETYIERFMPESPGDRIDKAVRRVLEKLIDPARRAENEEAPGAH